MKDISHHQHLIPSLHPGPCDKRPTPDREEPKSESVTCASCKATAERLNGQGFRIHKTKRRCSQHFLTVTICSFEEISNNLKHLLIFTKKNDTIMLPWISLRNVLLSWRRVKKDYIKKVQNTTFYLYQKKHPNWDVGFGVSTNTSVLGVYIYKYIYKYIYIYKE